MIGREERGRWRRQCQVQSGGWQLQQALDHADEADRIIAEMLRQADLAGPGCAMRVRGAVPDEWLPEGEGA